MAENSAGIVALVLILLGIVAVTVAILWAFSRLTDEDNVFNSETVTLHASEVDPLIFAGESPAEPAPNGDGWMYTKVDNTEGGVGGRKINWWLDNLGPNRPILMSEVSQVEIDVTVLVAASTNYEPFMQFYSMPSENASTNPPVSWYGSKQTFGPAGPNQIVIDTKTTLAATRIGEPEPDPSFHKLLISPGSNLPSSYWYGAELDAAGFPVDFLPSEQKMGLVLNTDSGAPVGTSLIVHEFRYVIGTNKYTVILRS